MRAYKFRIYPSKRQEKLLNIHLCLAKNLWNELLAHCKETYNDFGYFPTRNTLQLMVKDYGLYSQTQQEIAHRVHNSVIRVFKLKKKGIKCGFPRFKSIDRMKSLQYPQFGFSLDNKLNVTPFGEISIKKHREIKGKIKTLTLKRMSSGKWFAIFCVEQEKIAKKVEMKSVIGIDMGIKHFLTDSKGIQVENPEFYEKILGRMKIEQKRLSNKNKDSKNFKKQKVKLAKSYEKLVDKRNDLLHKLSNFYANNYDVICIENLDIRNMVKNHSLAQKILDASWGKFIKMLSYKAENAGRMLIRVDPRGTSKEYKFGELDKDYNASLNILERGLVGLGRPFESVEMRPLQELVKVPASLVVEAGNLSIDR